MEIRNGYIISENSENPQEKLQNYLIETVQDTKIIYAIIWGENEAVKKAVTYADDIAEPGDFAPDGFLYKQRFSSRTMKLNFATLYRDLFNAALDRTYDHPIHLRSI